MTRRGFTLIELLVVVLVMASLIGIVFRLSSITGSQTAEAQTVVILQKLENCLSGYYAAFGNYPPVKLHGSRNIFYKVNRFGIQQVEEAEQPGVLSWSQVRAACKSQPVAINYPYSSEAQGYIDDVAKKLKEKHDKGLSPFCNCKILEHLFDGIKNPAMLNDKRDMDKWTDAQIFRFGLLSFLLPRYAVMMQHSGRGWYDDKAKTKRSKVDQDRMNLYDFKQWGSNNQLPCRFDNGIRYDSWADFAGEARWRVMLMPSQAVVQRWAPNLAELLDFYDAETCSFDEQKHLETYVTDAECPAEYEDMVGEEDEKLDSFVVYSAGDSQSGAGFSGSQLYVLNGATIRDSWGREVYYYSPRPYQTYRLWSAGANGKTFPPWVPEETIKSFNAKDQKTIAKWLSDDIVKMKN